MAPMAAYPITSNMLQKIMQQHILYIKTFSVYNALHSLIFTIYKTRNIFYL